MLLYNICFVSMQFMLIFLLDESLFEYIFSSGVCKTNFKSVSVCYLEYILVELHNLRECPQI